MAEIVVRNWGVLVGFMGVMLMYGANRPQVRPHVLMVAGVSKPAFITLILFYGRQYLTTAGLVIGIDLVMVVLSSYTCSAPVTKFNDRLPQLPDST